MTALLTASLLVGPFVLLSPAEFIGGIFGHWGQAQAMTAINLSYYLTRVMPARYLVYVQAGVVLAGYAWCSVQKSSPRQVALPFFCLLILMAFIMLNRLIWVYFYIPVGFLMVTLAWALVGTGDGNISSVRPGEGRPGRRP
ncbi:MAG: hypothetical protein AB1641_30460 [Thermodesulfobacteriota bacterium]